LSGGATLDGAEPVVPSAIAEGAGAKVARRPRHRINLTSRRAGWYVRREAAPWRDAAPAERVAHMPWFRSLWPGDVRARATAPEPPPASRLAILERLKQPGD